MTGATDTCRDVLERIAAYLDGELGPVECERIEEHCTTCEACARVVEGLRETVGLCRRAATAPLPEGVRALALARLRRLLESPDDTGGDAG